MGRLANHASKLNWVISIHPSRVGWDRRQEVAALCQRNFNPPIPCGMGLRCCDDGSKAKIFQSTHPVWDGTRLISIPSALTQISIHPSRVGWDDYVANVTKLATEFQSTHPVWDGTLVADEVAVYVTISIHPSRVGWDW